MARVFVYSVEVNGFGRRQLMILGRKGTVKICPLERPITTSHSDTTIADIPYDDRNVLVLFEDHTLQRRYDEMMKDVYSFIIGGKSNLLSYEHEYAVEKTSYKITGGDF